MKIIIKKLVFIISVIVVSPILILYFLLNIVSNGNQFAGFSQLMSLIPGKIGSYLRRAFYKFTMKSSATESVIYFGTVFSQTDTIIEQGVYIGAQCNIGSCHIKKNALIASGVHIMSGKNQHNFDDIETPIQQQGGVFEQVIIGEDSWVGNGALIMANVGRKCIVGAGSVVTKDVPDYSVVVGNPAKVVKSRLVEE